MDPALDRGAGRNAGPPDPRASMEKGRIMARKWQKRAIVFGVLGLLGLAIPSTWAYRSSVSFMRCGNRLVKLGEKKPEIAAKCGAPDFVDEYREEVFTEIVPDPFDNEINEDRSPIGRRFLKQHQWVEEWTYNRGPTRFLYYLKFRNGVLFKIETGPYGY